MRITQNWIFSKLYKSLLYSIYDLFFISTFALAFTFWWSFPFNFQQCVTNFNLPKVNYAENYLTFCPCLTYGVIIPASVASNSCATHWAQRMSEVKNKIPNDIEFIAELLYLKIAN